MAAVLADPQGTVIRQAEYKRLDDDEGKETAIPVEAVDKPSFRVPPRTAVRISRPAEEHFQIKN